MPTVIASFLRLVSSSESFQESTPVEDAVAFVDLLLAAQGVHLASIGPEWPCLRQLCIDKQLKGNVVLDARLAAATIEWESMQTTANLKIHRTCLDGPTGTISFAPRGA